MTRVSFRPYSLAVGATSARSRPRWVRHSPEEITIFVIASGAASATAPIPSDAVIVDVAATALTHLGVAIQPEWELDGRSLLSP